jgi:hypothetical protein
LADLAVVKMAFASWIRFLSLAVHEFHLHPRKPRVDAITSSAAAMTAAVPSKTGVGVGVLDELRCHTVPSHSVAWTSYAVGAFVGIALSACPSPFRLNPTTVLSTAKLRWFWHTFRDAGVARVAGVAPASV